MAMFGRKGLGPARGGGVDRPPRRPVDPRKGQPGHQTVLRDLAAQERDDPLVRTRLAGGVVYDLFVRMLADGGPRARVEDIVAALASVGGHLCLVGVFAELRADGHEPHDIGLVDVVAADGFHYFFGDAPNRLLIESPTALLSLVLGAAHKLGAMVSIEMVQEVMRRTASDLGGPQFGVPDLPEAQQPSRTPIELVAQFRDPTLAALDLYDVRPNAAAKAMGFALQRAINAGVAVLDPMMMARIAIECAVPMAKVDPARFD